MLFHREHNRIARLLQREDGWDDERIFQTARKVLTVILMKLVVEEYINHISPYQVKFLADPRTFRNPPWYGQNWMAIDFNSCSGGTASFRRAFASAGRRSRSTTRRSTPTSLSTTGSAPASTTPHASAPDASGCSTRRPRYGDAELTSILQARAVALRPHNQYRRFERFPPARRVEDISGDTRVRARQHELYGRVEDVEFFPGLSAEDVRPNSVLPPLIGRIVGIDAFSQAVTNPLLRRGSSSRRRSRRWAAS